VRFAFDSVLLETSVPRSFPSFSWRTSSPLSHMPVEILSVPAQRLVRLCFRSESSAQQYRGPRSRPADAPRQATARDWLGPSSE